MLENLYTTKMSGNKRVLQKRFTKIRSKSGKLAKMMSLVMTLVLLAALGTATVVMAAAGSDGLEHWDKNEIYFRDGVSFYVNVAGKNVPAWVYEDVAGEDGSINVTVTRYQTRDMNGEVNNEHLVSLIGTKGNVRLACNSWSMLNDTLNNDLYIKEINPDIRKYKYYSSLRFIEFSNPGYFFEKSPIASLVDIKESKFRGIEVYFAFDENKKLQSAYLSLLNNDQNDNPISEVFDSVQANGDLSYIGSFEADYTNDITDFDRSHNYYFTIYEDNYQNKTAEGVDIDVLSSSLEGIVVKTDVDLPEADKIIINVYGKSGRKVAYNSHPFTIENQYNMTPAKALKFMIDAETGELHEMESDVPENQFVPGEEYRVCVVVMDKNYTVLYRWQKYVTVQ